MQYCFVVDVRHNLITDADVNVACLCLRVAGQDQALVFDNDEWPASERIAVALGFDVVRTLKG